MWGAKPRLASDRPRRSCGNASTTDRQNRVPPMPGRVGLTGTMEPASTQPRWLGEKPAPVTLRCSRLNSRPPLTDEVLLFAPRLMHQAWFCRMQWTSKLRSSCS